MGKLIAEASLPRRRYKKLAVLFDEVIRKNSKFVRYEFDLTEYKNVNSAKSTLYRGIKSHGVPLRIHKYYDVIYFERTDM